jgi:hypothetical protein
VDIVVNLIMFAKPLQDLFWIIVLCNSFHFRIAYITVHLHYYIAMRVCNYIKLLTFTRRIVCGRSDYFNNQTDQD